MEILKENAKSLEHLDDQMKAENERILTTITGLKDATAAPIEGDE